MASNQSGWEKEKRNPGHPRSQRECSLRIPGGRFYMGRLCPKGLPLSILNTILARKGTLLVLPPFDNGAPFTHLVSLCPFNFCKCNVFEIWIPVHHNLFSTFSQPYETKNAHVGPFEAFLEATMTDFPTLSYTSASEILTLSYITRTMKKVPL